MSRVETLVLAISGGVDSVVMLDKLLQTEHNLVIAHFDHGIRGGQSHADADFVRRLALEHDLPYEIMSGGLGVDASEDQARAARYEFLRQVARTYGGRLCTAHHADDVIESIAINASRGTGWRGLAVMGAGDIYRPLINLTKAEIYEYAKEHKLKWHEDHTNQSDRYLRNRLRQKIAQNLQPHHKQLLYELYQSQTAVKTAIEAELGRFFRASARYQRYFFIMIKPKIAQEVLRYIVHRHTGLILTRPQADRAVLAIKTAKLGETMELSPTVRLKFNSHSFLVESD